MCATFLPEYMRVGRGAMKVGYCQNIVKIHADKISKLAHNERFLVISDTSEHANAGSIKII